MQDEVDPRRLVEAAGPVHRVEPAEYWERPLQALGIPAGQADHELQLGREILRARAHPRQPSVGSASDQGRVASEAGGSAGVAGAPRPTDPPWHWHRTRRRLEVSTMISSADSEHLEHQRTGLPAPLRRPLRAGREPSRWSAGAASSARPGRPTNSLASSTSTASRCSSVDPRLVLSTAVIGLYRTGRLTSDGRRGAIKIVEGSPPLGPGLERSVLEAVRAHPGTSVNALRELGEIPAVTAIASELEHAGLLATPAQPAPPQPRAARDRRPARDPRLRPRRGRDGGRQAGLLPRPRRDRRRSRVTGVVVARVPRTTLAGGRAVRRVRSDQPRTGSGWTPAWRSRCSAPEPSGWLTR